MRGIPHLRPARVLVLGITPAHAGNTAQQLNNRLKQWDHPRACGEYETIAQLRQELMGSPPRMRGILCSRFRIFIDCGITPAHAGNTNRDGQGNRAYRDHPRACGEYACYSISALPGPGSPPRMRGIPELPVPRTANLGITPAHAGNTKSAPRPSLGDPDHPRACGEYMLEVVLAIPRLGSPPRMRGILIIR